MKKILITAPLRQDVDIFEAYQDSLDRLEVPEGFTVDRFFFFFFCDEVIPHIRNARIEVTETGEAYEKTHNDHLWTLDLMWKMGELRNRTIREMLDGGYDYWLSVDTDIVLDPWTLYHLLNADKDIVSEIFWTQAPNGKYWCNAWMYDQSFGMPEEWHKPGLYQVGMTGALTLVKRKVFEAGVSYEKIPAELKPILIDCLRWSKYDMLLADYFGKIIDIDTSNRIITKVKKTAGIEFNMYMLRHQFSSDLFRSGTDPAVIRDLMGHESATMSLDYATTKEEDRKKAVDKRKFS